VTKIAVRYRELAVAAEHHKVWTSVSINVGHIE
jgi:hypothetical protein